MSLFLSTAATAANKTVAVLQIEARPGALSAADAAALTREIRDAAKDALAGSGFEVVDAEGTPQAALQNGAVAALFGRAAPVEGATVVAVGVHQPGAGGPASVARVVGFGIDQLRSDARAKIPPLLTAALGLSAPLEQPRQRPGTLRIPGGTPQAKPEQPPPAPQPPKAQLTPPPPVPHDPNEAPIVTLIREVTLDVEQLRGLRRKQNLKILILDETLFSKALREKALKELTPSLVATERARWTAFSLAPPDADPARILLGVLDEQVAGFYDPFAKQLIVRRDPPAAAAAKGDDDPADGRRAADETLRVVLAHEIEHALQDQNFGIPDLRTLPDDDARLARSALLEGDAMAVMTAYGARRAHKPIKAAILGGAAMLRAVDAETLLRLSGKSPALLKAPAILREELVVPYAAGFALVAEVYRRGGFALVDKMFKNPPSTSHQVLHPDAYLAGEQPALLPPPQAPKGSRVLAQGRMGELGARVALEVCVDKAVVRDFVSRWQGDAYTVVEDAERKVSLLWTSTWNGDGAGQIGNLMRLEQPCWEEGATRAMAGSSKIGTAGTVVALARGSVDLGAALAQLLAARPELPPPSPPIGEVPPPAALETARIENGEFTSSRLALQGTVPEGYAQDATNSAAELSIKRASAGTATLSLVPEPLAGEALETFFQTASGQIATAQGTHLSLVSSARRKLAGLNAEERTWALEGARTRLRIDVAPYCEGKASLTLLRVETGDTARDALERFAASITSMGEAPACADLE